MSIKTKTKTEQILMVMPFLAWVGFIAFMIEAGAVLFSYGVSCVTPEGAKNLYKGLDLYNLLQFNFWYYTLSVSFMVILSLMKSWVCFLIIKALSQFNLTNPFSMEMADRLEKISYVALGTWVVTMLSNALRGWLFKLTGELNGNWISGEFIIMVALVFIIAQVFKRGVEIQSENDLTV